MSEEPRRSVRATKGQHKNLEHLDQPVEAPKKRSGKKGTAKAKQASQELSAAEDDEHSNDIIRCICGVTDQDDESDEMWIACNTCDAWQHNVCVGAPLDPKIADEMDYFCEQCRPEAHQEYFEAQKRGEEIWKTRRQKFAEEQAAAKAKRGKKGKGRKSGGADMRAATPQSVKAGTPAPAESNKKTASTKRKTREDSHDGQSGMNKAVKLSTQSPTPKAHNAGNTIDFANAVKSLEQSRTRPVEQLNKSFVVSLGIARQTGQFAGQNVEQMAQRFALDLEQAVHNASISKAAYGNQVRALFNNIKTNPELTTRILDDFGYIETLAHMPHAEMATKKRQREDEEMRARAEKQAIMVTDENSGPRIRRTHKGDELVEYDQGSPDEESANRRRSMADPNHGMGARSREGSAGPYHNTTQGYDNGPSGDRIRQNAMGQGQLTRLDTAGSPGVRRQSTAADNFDINSVYSKVQTPVSAHHRTASTASNTFAQPQQPQNIHDADVDRLLNDDDDGDEDAYDPPDYQEGDPSVVWRGTMTMTSIADFPAVARHVAGADLRGSAFQWRDLLEDRLSVAGRIDPGKAEEYLCSLRFSPSTDVCVVSLSPSGGPSAQKQFQSLYDHFELKGKYGVLGSKTNDRGNIRDTYLIPVAPNRPDRPEFLLNFSINNLPSNRTEPMMLIAIVVRNERSPMGSDGANEAKGITAQNRSLSIGQQPGPSMSPVVQQGQAFGSAPQTPQQGQGQYAGGYNAQQQRPQGSDVGYNPAFPAQGMPPQQQPQQANATNNLPPLSSVVRPQLDQNTTADPHASARAVAVNILGEYAQCEVANFLMTQAHKMVDKEWWIIKSVFEGNEEARRDVRVFSQELETRGPHTPRQERDLKRIFPGEPGENEQRFVDAPRLVGVNNGLGQNGGLNGNAGVGAVAPAAGHAYQNIVMGGVEPSPKHEGQNL